MKLTIKITKEVLEATKMCRFVDSKNCAISYAVRQIFPNAAVTGLKLYFDTTPLNDQEWVFCATSKEVSAFVARFDGLHREPEKRVLLPEFSFEIDVPDSVIEKIGIETAKEIISKSSTLEPIEP